MPGPVAEPDPLQQLGGPGVRGTGRHPVDHQRKGYVLDGAQHGHQVEELEDEPEVPAPECGPRATLHRPQVPAADDHAAAVRGVQSPGDMQQGRFAGPRRTGNHHEFACVRGEIEVDEHPNVLPAPAVRLAHAVELHYRLGRNGRHIQFGHLTPPRPRSVATA